MSAGPVSRKGAFVVVVGPDGVGKSDLARALLEIAPVFSGYFHFRPPIRHPLLSSVPNDESPALKNLDKPSVPLGWLRLCLAFVRFWAGYEAAVRPAIRRGGLVIGDRWAYGYLVQPRALRYGGPRWLAQVMINRLPSPDLVVNLAAPPFEIRRRKQELTAEQIADELDAWARIPVPRMITVDALQTSWDMADRVISELDL